MNVPIDVDAEGDRELDGHSPTELADDDDPSSPPGGVLLTAEEVKTEMGRNVPKKKKRERQANEMTKLEEGEEDSPTKRALQGGDAPLSGRELRELLQMHMFEMRTAWGEERARVDRLEAKQASIEGDIHKFDTISTALKEEIGGTKEDVVNLKGRASAIEQKLQDQSVVQHNQQNKINEVIQDLAKLKTDVGNNHKKGDNAADSRDDPWAAYLASRNAEQTSNGQPLQRRPTTRRNDDNELTDEEKRTLILGGWPQDSKKAVIESESRELLKHPSLQGFLDVTQATVYGPRRSVGSLKFEYREQEDLKAVKERMWGVIKALRERGEIVPSARGQPGAKPAWAAFVKTQEARKRTSLVSQIRRVTMQLAIETVNEQGGPKHPTSAVQESFDCDWNNGTVWLGPRKLGSSTHRQPHSPGVILMPGGWIDIPAICDATGCSEDTAKRAFEREL